MEVVNASALAYVAVFSWPLVSILIYRLRPFSEATAWTILGALLLLPSQFAIKVPMIPAIDKSSVSVLSALVGCLFFAPRPARIASGPGLAEVLIVTFLLGPVITSVLNNDVIVVGDRVLPGVGVYDGVSALLSQTISFLPFFIGRRFLGRSSDPETILGVLAIAGLFYSLPMLFEIRFSPQLSNWIYGYFPSSFSTEIRYDGFRPVVFMDNGLAAAFFLGTAVLAAAAFWRAGRRVLKLPSTGVLVYLEGVLIICKSAGALAYSVFIGALVLLAKPTRQTQVAAVLAVIALVYPLLRATNYFPTDELVSASAALSQERAQSLEFRFEQEERLLTHASDRFFFGWGRYGRNRIYDESGQDRSITDGLWILTLGQFGIIGFLAQFGLLTLPIFRANSGIKKVRSQQERLYLAVLAMIAAITAVEQLPNASITPWSWLIVGALLARTEQVSPLAVKSRRLIAASGSTSTGPMSG